MTSRRRPNAPVPDPWEDEGRRLAPQLASLSAAVVLGASADIAARVAIAAAREVAQTRRAALADLTGVPRMRALAGPDDGAPGITDCFVRGLSLNDAARPAADGPATLFVLPRGSEALSADVLASARWGRLAAGFAEADALLLIIAPAGTDGLDALVPQTDGVVAVGGVEVPMAWRVVAQVGDPTMGGAPSSDAGTAQRGHGATPVRYRRDWIAAGVVALVAAGVVGAMWLRTRGTRAAPPTPTRTDADTSASARVARNAPPAPTSAVDSGPHRNALSKATRPLAAPDTLAVPDPVNPQDRAMAAEFAVELVATNTLASANLWVRERAARLPGVTVAPVAVGSANVRWYRVVTGAFRDRAAADALLASLHRDRVLDAGAGRVMRAPLALLLESQVPRGAAAARVAAYAARGVDAYALLQDDGTARLYAGAFETAPAAVPLDAELRAGGLVPQLAYRTGRP
ncbi:MAG: SPOR domain-containing protein, partial [Gemmatimonadaceae bacterium]|nr:SPOR domain-containing protein [Gemmatimonadaceae bacterium]